MTKTPTNLLAPTEWAIAASNRIDELFGYIDLALDYLRTTDAHLAGFGRRAGRPSGLRAVPATPAADGRG